MRASRTADNPKTRTPFQTVCCLINRLIFNSSNPQNAASVSLLLRSQSARSVPNIQFFYLFIEVLPAGYATCDDNNNENDGRSLNYFILDDNRYIMGKR